jgi:hypothetical protein
MVSVLSIHQSSIEPVHETGTRAIWRTAHWLGRKFKITMPAVMQRFSRDNSFATEKHRLLRPTELSTLQYKQRFLKPNPYLIQGQKLEREELPNESHWTGYETRPGVADLRPLILERDQYICHLCGVQVTDHTAEIDHIRPVRRFKRPIDANTLTISGRYANPVIRKRLSMTDKRRAGCAERVRRGTRC